MENTQIGPFLIVERLGKTRRQKIWRARQVEQSRDVALKFINLPPSWDRSRALEKLAAEFDLLRQLRHPHLARIFGAGVFGEQIFVASELVRGESLASLIGRRGRIAVDLAVEFGRQIASCLEYLHGNQLLHCKLTPDKVLIGPENMIKVTDLRLNRKRKRKPLRRDRRDMELVAYLAPEQLAGDASHKSDIYSLGVVMYEMLTGHLPFSPENLARHSRAKSELQAEPICQTVLECPVWLDRLVLAMLDPNPRKRPHTAAAVRMTLEEIQKSDQTRRGAAENLAGSFNPLNAGADKSEAVRLLHGHAVEPDEAAAGAWWKRTPVLAILFLLALSTTVWALWPQSPQAMYQSAQVLLNSDQPSDWSSARNLLTRVQQRVPGTPLADRAAMLFAEARQRTLLDQARRNARNNLQSEAVQEFIGAWQDEHRLLFGEAWRRYDLISKRYDGSAEDGYVVQEAEYRREQLEPLRGLPENTSDLQAWIAQTIDPADRDGRDYFRRQLEAVALRLRDNKAFAEIVRIIEERLASLPIADEPEPEGSTP